MPRPRHRAYVCLNSASKTYLLNLNLHVNNVPTRISRGPGQPQPHKLVVERTPVPPRPVARGRAEGLSSPSPPRREIQSFDALLDVRLHGEIVVGRAVPGADRGLGCVLSMFNKT